jgi:UDP-sugar diphosphatase
MFYTEVDDSMRVSSGGGVDTEDIELVYLAIDQIEKYVWDESVPKPSGLLLALLWFLRYKVPLTQSAQ